MAIWLQEKSSNYFVVFLATNDTNLHSLPQLGGE
jgi:hypothetical protein